jgi:hypothetical protein
VLRRQVLAATVFEHRLAELTGNVSTAAHLDMRHLEMSGV